jgi:hypothetical protein
MLLKYLFILFCFGISMIAYELPEVKIDNQSDTPKIILFNATSIVVGEKLSYQLKWKTQNAPKVTLTFFGDVSPSGELKITQEEYNYGPITLTASNPTTGKSESFTLNKINKDLPAPVQFDKPKERDLNMGQSYRSQPFRQRRPYPPIPRRRY